MALIVVSFCNQTDEGGPLLAAVDEATRERRLVTFAREDFVSACGLASDGTFLYCAVARSDPNSCAVLQFQLPSFALVDTFELPTVADVHSIVLDGDAIIAVSTGNDRVVRVDRSGRADVVWRAGESGLDTQHLNSLVRIENRLLCCAFGRRFGTTWGDAVDGYIYDISAGRAIARGLYQPHSLTNAGGALYFCESGNNVLRSLERPIVYTNGYTRGLAIRENGDYAVGCSVGRRAATAPGVVANAFDPGEPSGSCALEIGNVAGGATSRIDFGDVSREIYDVLLID